MFIATNPRHKVLNNSAENLKLEILGSELEVVTKIRYLGVQIENSLDWNECIKVIFSKVSRAIGFLKYAKNILPIASVKALYTSIVEPHFRYCCSVWGWCSHVAEGGEGGRRPQIRFTCQFCPPTVSSS